MLTVSVVAVVSCQFASPFMYKQYVYVQTVWACVVSTVSTYIHRCSYSSLTHLALPSSYYCCAIITTGKLGLAYTLVWLLVYVCTYLLVDNLYVLPVVAAVIREPTVLCKCVCVCLYACWHVYSVHSPAFLPFLCITSSYTHHCSPTECDVVPPPTIFFAGNRNMGNYSSTRDYMCS